MTPQFAVFVVLLGAVNQGMAACENKPPMANYTADLVPGKFYLLITKIAFNHQNNELRCGTSYIESAVPPKFMFYVSTQSSQGNVNYAIENITNLSPPGTWLVDTVDGTFQASVIGSIKGKVNIYHACNKQTGKEAVWVYYYRRINATHPVENASIKYIFDTLAQNQISVYGFKIVNNNQCKN